MKTGDFTTNRQIVKLSALALCIGALCAIIAIALLKSIYFLTHVLFYHRISFSFVTPTGNELGASVIILPIVGALIVGLIARFGSEKVRGHGIPEAIEVMLTGGSKIQPRVAFWKPISAAVSIGTGGPFGAEGPIIMTGGSFGSLLGQFFHLSSMERRILLVAGAAGGMSATFSAPLSSIMFAVELLVFEFKPRSLVPIALASSVADMIRVAILGKGPIFAMPSLSSVHWLLLLVAALIGVSGSVLAVLLTWAIYFTEDVFRKIPVHWMWYPAIGAVVIGVGGWISPRSLGIGYDSITAMLNVKLGIMVLLGIFVVKTVIWVVALGSGTSGGILAPILIIGGSLGAIAGEVTHAPNPGVWALLGMSAIFSGVTRTPITSVIFPVELTHNFGALLPLIVTSAIACGISSRVLKRSILTEKIARRGLHLTREYSVDPLQMHYCREFAYIPEHIVSAETLLDTDEVSNSMSSIEFVGVEQSGEIIGVIPLSALKQSNSKSIKAIQFIQSVPTMSDTHTVKDALREMVYADCSWVRIVSTKTKRPIGILTMRQIQEIYRRESDSEIHRERVFRVFRIGDYPKSTSTDLTNGS